MLHRSGSGVSVDRRCFPCSCLGDADHMKDSLALRIISEQVQGRSGHFLPDGQSTIEFCFSAFGETQPSFSPVFAPALGDPTVPGHDLQSASQGGAVHREHFAQLPLRYLSGARKHLKDRELSAPQPKWAERLLIKLGERPGGSAETSARAPQFR